MAEPFSIDVTAGAEADLKWFSAYARRIILDGVELHLRHQPTVGTRRIKTLRSNPVAGWELRLGDYRVLYDVDEPNRTVILHAAIDEMFARLTASRRRLCLHPAPTPSACR